jgi:hypothetical protein
MKTIWQVRRTTVPQDDGERRWDNAYQFLLHWALEHEAGQPPAPLQHQEDSHGSRSVRSGLTPPATTTADD